MMLLAALLVSQAGGDSLHSLTDLVLAETSQRKPAIVIKDIRIGRYSPILKSWMRVFSLKIENKTSVPWSDFEVTLNLSSTEAHSIAFTIPNRLEPQESLTFEKTFVMPPVEQIRSASLSIQSAVKGRALPYKYFSGILMLAADCASDYRAFSKMVGVALRSAISAFLLVKCGETVDEAAVETSKVSAIPGFLFVKFENGLAGWVPVGTLKSAEYWEFQSTGLEVLKP